jgi:hypothetical protein
LKALRKLAINGLLKGKLSFILFLVACCALFAGNIIPGFVMNDLVRCRLKGKVKSVMEYKYTAGEKTDSALKGKIIYQKYMMFDVLGFETQSSLFDDGNEYLTSVYTFGADGKQVEMNEYKPGGILNLTVTYKFDKKGFRSEADYSWAENRNIGQITDNTDYYYEIIQNDIFTKVMYKNDYRGFCVEENYLKADSSLSFKITSKYDFRGNKLENAYFHRSGRLSWMTKYKYDKNDNLVESRVFKSNRTAVLSKYKYKFDAAGNWVVRTELRTVEVNILTEGLERENTITERTIEYYPTDAN